MSSIQPQPATSKRTGVDAMRDLLRADLDRVNGCIQSHLQSDVVLINRVSSHIVGGGGKRLRPMLLLLAARACDYRGEAHIPLAAAVEFIHTATLLHDDVVDESGLRRGRDTANAAFGNAASVLVGDYIYSRAFQMMVQADSMRVLDIMADATNTIAEGEVMQLMHSYDPAITETQYLRVIEAKTAKLFEAAARLGAVLAQRSASEEAALSAYGLHLGLAFQIADDALDYEGDTNALGKNAGDDLTEGKLTLPLIHALSHAGARQRETIVQSIQNGSREDLGRVLNIIKETGALDYTMQRAQNEANQARAALDGITASEYRDALIDLTDYAVDRTQ